MNVRSELKNEAYKLTLLNGEVKDGFSGGERDPLRMVAGRGDIAVFQLLLSDDEDFCVNVGKEAFFSQRGMIETLRVGFDFPFPVKVHIEGMVKVNDSFSAADILLDTDTAEYSAGDHAAVFFGCEIGRDAEPGEYTGKVTVYAGRMFEDERVVAERTVSLKVYPFTYPEPGKGKFYLDLWQHSSNIARHADVKMWSPEHFSVIKNYLESLAALGQKALTIVVTEAPWNGQRCYDDKIHLGNLFEYSIVHVKKDKKGSFVYDFSDMQRYIDIGRECGICDEISLYGLINIWGNDEAGFNKLAPDYPDGIRLRYFDEASGEYRYAHSAKEIDEYIKALEQYFVSTGQIDIVRVAADEPGDVDAFRKSLSHLASVAPAFKYKAAINHASFIGEFGKEIYDFAPHIGCLSKEYAKIAEYKRKMTGKRFIWYVCCGPEYPNTFIASPLTESYFIGVITSYFKLDGFLRWDYTVWSEDPRKDVNIKEWPAGDSNFVYPGYDGRPLLSLRYYALMRGIRIFELLEAYRNKCGEDKYNAAVEKVVRMKDIGNYFVENADGERSLIPPDAIMSPDHRDYSDMIETALADM